MQHICVNSRVIGVGARRGPEWRHADKQPVNRVDVALPHQRWSGIAVALHLIKNSIKFWRFSNHFKAPLTNCPLGTWWRKLDSQKSRGLEADIFFCTLCDSRCRSRFSTAARWNSSSRSCQNQSPWGSRKMLKNHPKRVAGRWAERSRWMRRRFPIATSRCREPCWSSTGRKVRAGRSQRYSHRPTPTHNIRRRRSPDSRDSFVDPTRPVGLSSTSTSWAKLLWWHNVQLKWRSLKVLRLWIELITRNDVFVRY